MTKKRRISYLILLTLAILTSCKKPTEGGTLEVQGTHSVTFAIPTAGRSCVDDGSDDPKSSLAEVYADFGKLKYTWKGTKPFEIKYIHVSLRGGGLKDGKFNFPVPPDELALILAGSPVPIPGATTPDGVPYTSACSIRVGGIGFTDITRHSTASGTITVFGVETDTDGQSVPVSADTQIAIEFMGKPQ